MRGQWLVTSWLHFLVRTALGAILLILAAAALSDGAGAQTHAAIGAKGDHQILDQCPGAGSYLVGFKVKSGDRLNQIAIICSPVDGAGHTGAQWVGTPRGGTGGSPAALWATGDQVAVLMDKALNVGQQNDLDAAFVAALGIKD
jgi:hypothetical protein